MRHPSCRSTWLPQSGQAPRAISSSPAERDAFFAAGRAASATGFGKPGNIASKFSRYHSIAFETASAQERIFPPLPPQEGRWQEIPFSCLTIIPGCTPDRSAREARRPIASDCDAAQPPAFPIWLNTSKIPFSSRLIVT